MSTFELAGIYPALPTFFEPSERLDLDLIAKHVNLLSDLGITQFVVLGSNGEAVSLTAAERQEVVAKVYDEVIGRVHEQTPQAKVVAGAGGQSVRMTIAFIKDAQRAGAHAALVLTPYYYVNPRTRDEQGIQETLVRFYQEVAEQSQLPIILYTMPNVAAGVDISVESVLTLARHPNIVGLKDSSGNIEKIRAITTALASDPAGRRDFSVIVGSGSKLYPALEAGARGGILALANVAPRECLALLRHFEAQDYAEAERLQSTLAPVNDLITSGYGVAGLKAALRILHLFDHPDGHYAPRLPLLPLTESEALSKIELALRGAGLRDALRYSRPSQPR